MKDKKLVCKTDISNDSDIIGTSLIGYVNLNFQEIKSIFGKPGANDGYKTDWEWAFKLNGTPLRIYNYKDGPNYTGKKSIKGKDIEDWHVGGKYSYDLIILEYYIKQEKPEYNDGRILTIAG